MSRSIEELLIEHSKGLDKVAQIELIKSMEALSQLHKQRKFHQLFPDKGIHRRELYGKHVEFFDAGANYRERLFMAANRVGKSEAGSFEATCHATGLYPIWWKGKRFTRATNIWIGGDTNISVRDIIQQKLLGNFGEFGTGMIPADCIQGTTTKRAVPEAVESIKVKHISGGTSIITFKTYEQGRELWQGTAQDVIWLDEEPPQDVYSEALMRTMTVNGIVMLTFTPLRGLSNVVLAFMENSQLVKEQTSKFMTTATWDDVPHLTKEMKDELWAAIPPNERDARAKGLPVIGSGLIYPIDESKVVIEDIPVPRFWPRMYGMDVGWNKTAVVWGALDRETDVLYIYSEYYAGEQEPVIHAKSIKARGEHIKGVIDPAARGRNQIDGKTLFKLYTDEGLHISPANNAVEAGIYEVWDRLNTGRLKIFKSCQNLQNELKLYHRDDKGKIKKTRDHLLDALRYLVNSNIYSSASTALEKEKRSNVIPLKVAAWT
jgi:phage terminase large subunit-like protein